MTWRAAWSQALYGPAGFYRRAVPRDHFRTSVHASPLFAGALLELARELAVDTVVDVGSGDGELLGQLHGMAPDLRLVGVELRARPPALPAGVDWTSEIPDGVDGLLVANELLDDIACDVVERDESGVVRQVEVQPSTGRERLGAELDEDVSAWLDRWWPIQEPGQRAEVGLSREDFWAAASARVRTGWCLAIDYGHLRDNRPRRGSMVSYRDGRLRPLALDGEHDVTAAVAMDALADRVGGSLGSQHQMLRSLGIGATRPPLDLASRDPAAYVRALARVGEAAELTDAAGLGGFHWLLTARRRTDVGA